MKVYRVVGPTGKGMYQEGFFASITGDGMQSTQRPGPWEDGIGDFSDDHLFGFSSKAQLKRWINKRKWRRALNENGAAVIVLKVPSVHAIKGRSQVVYLPQHAVQVAQLSVATI